MIINRVFFFLIILLSLFAIYCSIIIGVSWDEFFHHINGSHRAEYFKSFGKFKEYNYLDNRYYPGLYDTFHFLIINFILKFFSGNIYEIKHLVNLTFGLLTLRGLFLLSKNIFNKDVGYIAVLLCLLNPFFFGHMSINPKDTIVCFALIWLAHNAYMYCKNIERKRLGFLFLASLSMGFGLGVRVSFLATTIPIILSVCIFFLINKTKYQKIFFDVLIFLLISFSLMVMAWPHLLNSPYLLVDTIFQSIKWSMGPTLELMNGNIYETQNTPKTYFFNFFIFRKPIYILILLFVLIFFLKTDNNFFTDKFENFEKKLIVIFSIIVFPILLTIIFQVKIYNGIRLFLFIIPFLSMLSAISLYYILKNFKKIFYIKIIFNVIMLFFLIFLQRFIYLTPYHYDYSNFLKIKFINTEKLYVHDYWTTSYKELMKLIKADKSIKSIKSDFCGGDIHIVRHLSNKYSDGKIVFVPYEQADYIIMINTLSIDVNNKSTCFSLRPGKDMVAVERMGVKLSVLRKLKK